MLTPILYYLLASLPAPPPGVEDLRQFPQRQMIRETIQRHEEHRQWCEWQRDHAANNCERWHWDVYLDDCHRRAYVWHTLLQARVWHEEPQVGSVYYGPGGIPLSYEWGARLTLADLKALLGQQWYYGVSLPPLPQWPRRVPTAEAVPLPCAGR